MTRVFPAGLRSIWTPADTRALLDDLRRLEPEQRDSSCECDADDGDPHHRGCPALDDDLDWED